MQGFPVGISMSKDHLEKLISYLETELEKARQQLELLNPSSDPRIPSKTKEHKTGPLRVTTADKA